MLCGKKTCQHQVWRGLLCGSFCVQVGGAAPPPTSPFVEPIHAYDKQIMFPHGCPRGALCESFCLQMGGGGCASQPCPTAYTAMTFFCRKHGWLSARGSFAENALLELHLNKSLNKNTATSTQQVRQAKTGLKTYPVLGGRGARTPISHSTFPLLAALRSVCGVSNGILDGRSSGTRDVEPPKGQK